MEPLKVHQVLANNSQRKEFVIDLLAKVDLKPEHFDRYPHEFSGGQRQDFQKKLTTTHKHCILKS